jgi:hypothetical protein
MRPADLLKALGVLEKLHDLGDLLLGLVATRDVREGHPVAIAGQKFCTALAKAQRAPARLFQLPHEQEIEQADDDDKRQEMRTFG